MRQFANPGWAAGRKPANSGWLSGKLARGDFGDAHTFACSRSARRTVACQAPSASTTGPTTITGSLAASSLRASLSSASGAGANAPSISRCGSDWAVSSQSESGTDTSTGPRGACMAM